MKRFDGIDGMRAIAMTMVVLAHCKLLHFGWMGVWVFYVISGFVVCNSFHERMKQHRRDPAGVVRHFMARRAVRIWPVYFLYIILAASAFYIFSGVIRWGELAALFTFTYNWDMSFSFSGEKLAWDGFGHLWTISVEQQFYILFPLIYFLFLHHRATYRGALVILVLAPLIRFAMGQWSAASGADAGTSANIVYMSIFGHVDAFMIGALLARHREDILSWRWSEVAFWGAAFGVALVYCVTQISINAFVLHRTGAAVLSEVVWDTLLGRMQEVFVYYLPVLFAAALIVSLLKERRILRPFSWPLVAWIGQISYGAYVFHMAVIFLVLQVLPVADAGELGKFQRVALFLIAYPVTLALAHLSFVYFETRFSSRRKAVFR